MGSRRRPLGRSYSGNGRYALPSPPGGPQPGESEQGEGPGWGARPEGRSYLLSVRPEHRSTFCTIIAQLTEETQPQFETTLTSRAVSEDSDAKFTCIVTGYPQPEVTWYKDDEEMDRYCGLPKYEIFRHGNRHTLQLYKCREDDAAIYQASASNAKGIVSCSGVLEVGTMTEYKIHQRWFAKLKRKAEAKLREIEQSRKRGKENMELENLRRISPDRFQRKRRLTGDLNMRSGASLWEKEDGAKVHVAEAKSRLWEDVAELKEMPLNATPGLPNNFITRPLEAEVTTNGDSSMESGDENGHSFFTYIYETVEEITNKPTTRESFAKKQKKGEEPAALSAAKQDVPSQENGLTESQNLSQMLRKAPRGPPVAAAGRLVGDVPGVKELRTPSRRDAETVKTQPRSLPSEGDAYFSLTDMYLESTAKYALEEKPQAPQEAEDVAELQSLAESINRQRETPPPVSEVFLGGVVAGVALKGQPVPQELERNEARDTKVTKEESVAPGDSNKESVEPPSWTVEPSSETRHSLPVRSTPGTSYVSSGKDAQEPDLLDSVEPNTEQPLPRAAPSLSQASPCLELSQRRQEAGGSSLGGSLEEQVVFKVLCEAQETAKPVLSSASDLLTPSASEPVEDAGSKAGQLKELTGGKPTCMGRETEKSELPPSPRPRGRRVLKIGQESSQMPPAGSPGLTLPSWEERPPLKEEGAGPSLGPPGKETQQRPALSDRNEEPAAAGSALEEASRVPGGKAGLKPGACRSGLGKGAERAQPFTAEAQPAGSWAGESLSHTESGDSPAEPYHETSRQAAELVGGRPWVPSQAASVSAQVRKEEPCLTSIAEISASMEAPGLATPSPVHEGLAAGNQLAAQPPGEEEGETETGKTNESTDKRFPASTAEEDGTEPVAVSLATERGEEREQRAVIPGKEPVARSSSASPGRSDRKTEVLLVPRAEERTPAEEESLEHKVQHRNLVSSLKSYLLLLLKMSSPEPDETRGAPEKAAEAGEEGSHPAEEKTALPEVGIAGLSPSTSRKILARVQNNQLFQSAESLCLSPRTSRRLTGMINQELVTSQEALGISPLACRPLPAREVSESEGSAPLPVPSIVVGDVPLESRDDGLSDPPREGRAKENSGEAAAALPCATPEELASGARRKIYLPRSQPAEEAEAVASESQVPLKRDSPTVPPRHARKSLTLLQAPVPAPSPAGDRHSPTLTRKMATLEVPKAYEEPPEEGSGTPTGPEDPKQDAQAGDSRKTNNPFKAPQLIRKIRAEQFSDASGNLKLWCQFFNILSDSKLTWYKDEFPVAEARRSSGDEGQAALAIVQASRKDCGVYQCTIENEYGTDSTDFLLSPEVLSSFISREEIEVGEEIEMTPMVFAKGLADSGYWGDKFFGRIVSEEMEVSAGFPRKACRARAIYGLEPVFESGHTCVIKVRNLISFGTKNENTLVEKNYDITIQECRIQNSSREYCKIFAAEARASPDFGPVPEIIPLYLIYRPANTVPYATLEEDLAGPFERYCVKERDGSLAARSSSEVAQKCCSFQHWLYQWTNGNILVTDMEGVGWRITNVRIATKLKGYQGLKESCFPALLDQFAAAHQCNRYCEMLGLRSLEGPQQPAKGKGSKSPSQGRKAPSAQSSPQLPKKGLASPQGPRKGAVSPKASRKAADAGEAQPNLKHKAPEGSRSSQQQ
ncbi:alpha-protein kinase 3 isoform X2 [Carettochelys insculpta]|uniref:alpha-protein kinase 3 isoform X2 n=1 Tax=Carettochelys insculpta TaxID=44489 RepID=UPI003EB7FF8E